ncbi:hypothetical protein EAG_10242 [Camponotus floridanus]|uniref:Uncharacterized protein n=1 Tax=Camponotus floridanus TaxID=104421 RepID=E2AQV3_CAMFO|nr:hypothetical protein EAG_10242 [Camponotus floridanus]
MAHAQKLQCFVDKTDRLRSPLNSILISECAFLRYVIHAVSIDSGGIYVLRRSVQGGVLLSTTGLGASGRKGGEEGEGGRKKDGREESAGNERHQYWWWDRRDRGSGARGLQAGASGYHAGRGGGESLESPTRRVTPADERDAFRSVVKESARCTPEIYFGTARSVKCRFTKGRGSGVRRDALHERKVNVRFSRGGTAVSSCGDASSMLNRYVRGISGGAVRSSSSVELGRDESSLASPRVRDTPLVISGVNYYCANRVVISSDAVMGCSSRSSFLTTLLFVVGLLSVALFAEISDATRSLKAFCGLEFIDHDYKIIDRGHFNSAPYQNADPPSFILLVLLIPATSKNKDIYCVKGFCVWLLKLETLVRVSNVRNQGQSNNNISTSPSVRKRKSLCERGIPNYPVQLSVHQKNKEIQGI